MDRETIVVVSGLPRSGTSMMMRMLKAGGMSVVTDDIRTADEDNLRGYYEFERVKQLEQDRAWLPDAKGKVVKIISALLKHLPQEYAYRVIFMRRKMDEILASQKRMLVRRGEPTDAVGDAKMADLFRGHVKKVEVWLGGQSNIKVLYVSYNDVLEKPTQYAKRINRFLGRGLDVKGMVGVVDSSLYRQRR